jgi:YesN/AraC family two-component response regulator
MVANKLSTRPDVYLRELGASLTVLYVEDDLTVQASLKTILQRFFSQIDLACNGEEGLEKMRSFSYDLVISDINMPLMNGIEMISNATKEKIINKVLITSAHNETEKILTLINLGVDGFIMKPIDLNQLLVQLVRVCEPIHEHKMLEYYIQELENSNEELRIVNQQLDFMVSSLETHPQKEEIKETLSHLQHLPHDEVQQTYEAQKTAAVHNTIFVSAADFHHSYPIELGRKNEELENIEDDYDMLLSKASDDYSTELLCKLTNVIKNYAQTIEAIPHFQPLAIGIEELADTFRSIDDPHVLEKLMPMISSLFDTLHRWRVSVFVERNAENIHYLDDSIISDAKALKGMLGFSDASSENDAEFDLF